MPLEGQRPVVVALRTWLRLTVMPIVSFGVGVFGTLPLAMTLARNRMVVPAPVGTVAEVTETVEDPAGGARTCAVAPLWHTPVVSIHVVLQDSTTNCTVEGATAVPVYPACVMGRVPLFSMVKYWGVNEGCAVVPLFVNVSVSGPVPYGAAVLRVATAPQVPLPVAWDAEAALAMAAASAGDDVHASRTAAAMAAAALLG